MGKVIYTHTIEYNWNQLSHTYIIVYQICTFVLTDISIIEWVTHTHIASTTFTITRAVRTITSNIWVIDTAIEYNVV